ncbi:uncharacterized protein PV06_04831 [Exophiala oligosperma]|uniref:O-methyltransferase n=1 Tax=Exophiala oligosperma TaxID=215243 RepID=A0A0D2DLA1_9EURO|nr:uncharacterized protein PV06_04831 [Exophiala oligosperma]KIW43763.1 hypothetical protein PV06_04831 [Exophiala oligosperma]
MSSTGTEWSPPPANPLQGVPSHIVDLLARLHDESLRQEGALTRDDFQRATMDEVMRDKFIALDRDKAEFVYQLCRATGAETIVEAGTSFGVSTIYLALAASANASRTGRRARVVATEHEPTKAARARGYWAECGGSVSDVIDLREGDLRETLKTDLDNVDLLLLDIWTPMALPTLKVVEPKMRHGALVIVDNTIGAARGYKDMLEYLRNPDSGYINMTLPFSKGLEMSVYLPRR